VASIESLLSSRFLRLDVFEEVPISAPALAPPLPWNFLFSIFIRRRRNVVELRQNRAKKILAFVAHNNLRKGESPKLSVFPNITRKLVTALVLYL